MKRSPFPVVMAILASVACFACVEARKRAVVTEPERDAWAPDGADSGIPDAEAVQIDAVDSAA